MQLRSLFNSLKDGDSISFTYRFKEYGQLKERDLIVEADTNYKGDRLILSIKTKTGFLGSMNIDKVTPSRLKAYDYNMMSVRNTYDFIFKNIIQESIIVNRAGVLEETSSLDFKVLSELKEYVDEYQSLLHQDTQADVPEC